MLWKQVAPDHVLREDCVVNDSAQMRHVPLYGPVVVTGDPTGKGVAAKVRQPAARFYYLQKLAFGGKVQGQSFGLVASGGPRLNLLRIEEELSAVHIRLANVVIEHLPWHECVRRYDRAGTLFYLDPPYWQTEGYGVDFGMEQYVEMARLMRAMKGRAVLSINDHPQIRQAFDGLPLIPLQLEYSMARQATGKKSGELIIKSWEDDQLPMWG